MRLFKNDRPIYIVLNKILNIWDIKHRGTYFFFDLPCCSWASNICHREIPTRQDPNKTWAPSGEIKTVSVLYPANSQGSVRESHLPTTEMQPLAVRSTAAV